MSEAGAFARVLIVQSVWPVIVMGLALMACHVRHIPNWSGAHVVLVPIAILSAGATLILSLNILFDAVLFRVIARHPNELDGCVAVDDLLARLRLKRRPERTRGVAERIAGTRRLLRAQRACLGLSIGAVLAALLVRPA